MSKSADQMVRFGPFRFVSRSRTLFENERPVQLGSRAIEVLAALLERAGELVSKRELLHIVWPDTVVVEANLTVHVAALRRALGDGPSGNRYIINVSGRGYRFVAAISRTADDSPASPISAPAWSSDRIPAQLVRLVGRAPTINDIIRHLATQRLVTITGPGGIGKTVAALAIAKELSSQYEDGAQLADLSGILSPGLVASALASALQIEIPPTNSLLGLSSVLKNRKMLLVFDNCEHVIDEAAALATAILRAAPGIRILATSREAFRSEGEHVYRLPELETPPAERTISASKALGFSAVQLFVERASSVMNDFELTDDDAADVSRICRELEGIPLSIEFAAARADALSIRNIANALDDRLRFLTSGDRSTDARHRTIRAALDWSYDLLNNWERKVFTNLAVFAGGFDLESASTVIADNGMEEHEVANAIANLVQKSLIVADISSKDARFRLLETTRVYALAKLKDRPEASYILRRHAIYYRDLLERMRKEPAATAWLSSNIDNIRSALTWAHGPLGDRSVAVTLAAASSFVWPDLSLMQECRDRMTEAISALQPSEQGGALELDLQIALGLSARFAGVFDFQIQNALTRAGDIAGKLKQRDLHLQALSTLVQFQVRSMDLQEAWETSRIAQDIAEELDEPGARNTSDTIRLLCLFYSGDFEAAIHCAEDILARSVPIQDIPRVRRWREDSQFYAMCIMAQCQWVMGFPDQAVQTAKKVIDAADLSGLPILSCLVKGWTINMLIRSVDGATAKYLLSDLKETAAALSLPVYEATAISLEGLSKAYAGDLIEGERLLRRGLDSMQRHSNMRAYVAYLSSYAELLGSVGRPDEGLILASEALVMAKNEWWSSETMRIKGKLLMAVGTEFDQAERLLLDAIRLSQQRSALLFELRSTLDLSNLYLMQNRLHDGGERLKSVYSRYTEGFDTPDLIKAKTFITKLSRMAN